MAVPTSDARALHDLLEAVGYGQNAPASAWASILEAQWGTVDFATRHAEVVHLYTGTMTQIASLPDRTRARFEKYAWLWWMAVMAPQHAWSTNVDMASAVEPGALDQLGSAADLIESRMSGSLAVPTRTELDGLLEVCAEWVEAVVGATELPEPLRMNLLQDLRHIIWLIENANIFGVARVAAAGQGIVGSIAMAGEVVPPANRGAWLERGKKLLGAIVYLGALYQGFDVGLALTEGTGQFLGELTTGPPDGVPAAPGPLGAVDDLPHET